MRYSLLASRTILNQTGLLFFCLFIPAQAAPASVLKMAIPAVLADKQVKPHWRTPQLIETNDAGNAQSPNVAVDTVGNAIAVWQQSDGTRYSIWSSRYQADTGWGTPQLIESDNTGDALYPQVATDAAGNAITVWQQSDGTRYNIWASRYQGDTGWGTPQLIESNDAGDAKYPKVAVDAAGNAIVVWQQAEQIIANRYEAGKDWGTPQVIGNGPGFLWSSPAIAGDAAGNAMIIWSQQTQLDPLIPSRVWQNRYVVGSGWETAQTIDANSSYDARNPCIAINSTGNHAVAVWREGNGTGDSSLYARLYATGSGWGEAVIISPSVSILISPKASVDAAGNTIVAWTEGYKMASLSAARYEPGTGWQTPTVLIPSSMDLTGPDLGMDAAGNALLVWEQRPWMTYYIAASRYKVGGGWSTPQIIESATLPSNSSGVGLAVHPAGSAFALWARTDGSYANIWAARYE